MNVEHLSQSRIGNAEVNEFPAIH